MPCLDANENMTHQNELFLESPEINKLFREHGALEHVNVVDAMNRRIDLFNTAFTTVDGHKMVLEDADEKSLCAPNHVFRIRAYCQHLRIALV